MVAEKRLVVASPCRRCGILIPAGMPLDNVTWDPRGRTWAHRNPPCEVVEQLVREGMTPGDSLIDSNSRSTPAPPPERRAEAVPVASESLGQGSWSVTVEIHAAEDPAESKRVFRIARLHLRTFEEAQEVADRLREEL